jgi:hypothetical protein
MPLHAPKYNVKVSLNIIIAIPTASLGHRVTPQMLAQYRHSQLGKQL